MPRGEDVVRAYGSYAPRPSLIGLDDSKSAKQPGAMEMMQLDVSPKAQATVGLMEVPVPKGEADNHAQLSVSSFGTGWKLPAHKAHLIVMWNDLSGSSAIDSLSRFTSVLAAVTEAAPAVGVYWGNAQATHAPKFFMNMARSPEIVERMMLWTGVTVEQEPGNRISLLSHGMTQLELPDLLLTAPQGSAALETFFDLLTYVAERGTPLPEGDTIGRSATERLPVHYVPSPADPKKQVWHVELK